MPHVNISSFILEMVGKINMTKKEIITYEDLQWKGQGKSFYEGETKDGKRHGKGTMYYGATHGEEGDVRFEDFDDMKSKYELDKFYSDNRSHDDEAYTWEVYEGEWKEDEWHGRGTFYNLEGTKLKGWFINGKLDREKDFDEDLIKPSLKGTTT